MYERVRYDFERKNILITRKVHVSHVINNVIHVSRHLTIP